MSHFPYSRRRPPGARLLPRVAGAWLLAAWPLAARAAEPASAGGSLLQAVLGLGLVLVLMYGFFWLMRRYAPGQTAAQGVVKVVGGVMLSPRERLVVVEVADTWLLLGVAAGNVSLLHRLDKPDGSGAPIPEVSAGPFADRLAEWLRRGPKAG